jgi:hypothetical protein
MHVPQPQNHRLLSILLPSPSPYLSTPRSSKPLNQSLPLSLPLHIAAGNTATTLVITTTWEADETRRRQTRIR